MVDVDECLKDEERKRRCVTKQTGVCVPTAERAEDGDKADLCLMYLDVRVQGEYARLIAICACARAFVSLAKETEERLFTLEV